jgi:glycosyltransferase involved in cell wall biosynthesis
MSPHSVLMVTPRWARDGGVGAHVEVSARLLAEAGHEVTILVARIESSERFEGVTLHRSAQLCRWDAPIESRLGDALSFSPSVIHVHQIDDLPLVETLRSKAPVVVSAHGYTACPSGVYYFAPGEECVRFHGPGCVPHLIAHGCAHVRNPARLPAMYRRSARGLEALSRADLAVSYSSSVDRHLGANGLTRRRVIPYFPTLPARQSGGHARRRRVVFAGRIVPPKGVRFLLKAARSVEGEFVICGDGQQLHAMRRLARRLGLEGRVSFRGWLDPDQLAQELAEASLVVVPSLWPEPFGLVGIEGFAAGRPAVGTRTGGIGDWLQDGVNGLSVTPGDVDGLARALNGLLADPDRQQAMGAAGKELVAARFSGERHLAALLDCYELAASAWMEGRP